MRRSVGLDVHRDSIQVCILDERGQILQQLRVDLTCQTVEQFVRTTLQPEDQVALEATFHTWALVDRIAPHVGRVVVSNPLQTKAIAQAKIKTDQIDAHVLAQLLRCDFLPEVWQPDEHTRQLRRMHGRRASLVRQRISIRNRLHAVLNARLIRCPEKDLFSGKGLAWLQQLALDAEGRWMLDSDLRLLHQVQQEIDELEQQLCELAYPHAPVKLLMSLPGVDVRVAQTLVAAWGDIDRFGSAEQAASYLGLTPSVHQSGRHCYHGSITKAGRGQARWLLIQAAQHAGRHPGPLGVFFRRLCKRKNRNVAVVALARKLAVIGWRMLRSGEPYRYAIAKSTEAKLSRLRVRATGEKRRTGPAKGSAAGTRQAEPTRRVRSLDEVYDSEGLPPRPERTAGEARMLQERELSDWVEQLGQPGREKRSRRPRESSTQG
jgi:transposase